MDDQETTANFEDWVPAQPAKPKSKLPAYAIGGVGLLIVMGLAAAANNIPPDTRMAAEAMREYLAATSAATTECDKAEKMADGADYFHDAALNFATATAAKTACGHVSNALIEMPIPSKLTTDQQLRVRDGVDHLGTAYTTKSIIFGKLAKGIDSGRLKPSAIVNMRDSVSFAREHTLAGLTEIMGVAQETGVDIASLDIDEAKLDERRGAADAEAQSPVVHPPRYCGLGGGLARLIWNIRRKP